MEAYIRNVLKEAAIDAGEIHLNQCAFFLQEVWRANKKLNLTAAKSVNELIEKHLLDSLYLLKVMEPKGETFLDLGTGAGFPGAPLKFFLNDSPFYFLDASRRKINFLKYTLETMEMKKVFFINGRAEEIVREENYYEKMDVVCCRAVAAVKKLIDICMPFLKKEGTMILYKGPKVAEELKEAGRIIKKYNSEVESPFFYNLPGGEKRALIAIHKL